MNERKLMVRFYDYTEGFPSTHSTFRVDRHKFEHDVNAIIETESRFVGKLVLARNDATDAYESGKITARLHMQRTFSVKFDNSSEESVHNAYRLFVAKD